MRILYSTIFCLAAALPLLVASCSHSDPRTQALIDLRDEVDEQLAELAAGDWIIIGPSAELEQAAATPQVQHLTVMATNVSTLRQTLDLMERENRLIPRLWVCRELEQPGKKLTPGHARLRTHLQELLTGRTHFQVDERIIGMQLKQLKPEQKVLFIRTDTTQPHSSVGIELDCAEAAQIRTTPNQIKPKYLHAELIP